MSRTPCPWTLDTAEGDLHGRSSTVVAVSVEGYVLGQVRTQAQLARLEREGSAILIPLPHEEVDGELARILARGDLTGSRTQQMPLPAALRRRLADGSVRAVLSRQSNVSRLETAVQQEAMRDRRENRLVDGVPLARYNRTYEGGYGTTMPAADIYGVPWPRTPRDPGDQWRDRWAQPAETAAKIFSRFANLPYMLPTLQTAEGCGGVIGATSRAGEVLHARAWALATDDTHQQFGTSVGDIASLAARLPILRLRSQVAFEDGDPLKGSRLSDDMNRTLHITEAWEASYTAACRELLGQTRRFGGSLSLATDRSLWPTGPVLDAEERQIRRAVKDGASFIPSTLLEGLGQIEILTTPVDPNGEAPRGQFCPGAGRRGVNQIYVCLKDAQGNLRTPEELAATAAHELWHAVQASNQAVASSENAFVYQQPLLGVGGHDRQIQSRAAVLADPYAGSFPPEYAFAFSEFLPQALSFFVAPNAGTAWHRSPKAITYALGALSSWGA